MQNAKVVRMLKSCGNTEGVTLLHLKFRILHFTFFKYKI